MYSGLISTHNQFVQETFELVKYGGNIVTIFPSLLYLITNFAILYKFYHRYTRIGFTSFRVWFFRELTFQWAYFYVSKFWLLFIKSYKIGAGYVCEGLVIKDPTLNMRHCKLSGLFILSCISMIPFGCYVIRKCARTHIPNFLMWIAEDPWLRTEIGIAGHYLERPPRFPLPREHNLPYRSKRSTSIQERARRGTYVRISKSAGYIKERGDWLTQ